MLIHISKDMLGNDKSQQFIYKKKKKAGTMTSNVVHLLDLLIIKRKKKQFIHYIRQLFNYNIRPLELLTALLQQTWSLNSCIIISAYIPH